MNEWIELAHVGRMMMLWYEVTYSVDMASSSSRVGGLLGTMAGLGGERCGGELGLVAGESPPLSEAGVAERRSCLTVATPAGKGDRVCELGDDDDPPQAFKFGLLGSGWAIVLGVPLGFLDVDADAPDSSMRRRLLEGGWGLLDRDAGGDGGRSLGSMLGRLDKL